MASNNQRSRGKKKQSASEVARKLTYTGIRTGADHRKTSSSSFYGSGGPTHSAGLHGAPPHVQLQNAR